MSRAEIDKMMNKVKDWLVEEGIYKDKVPDESANWHLIVEFPSGSGMISEVIQPKNREDLVGIATVISLAEQHYKSVMAMPKPRRDEFLWDTRFQLLFLEAGFQIIPSVQEPQRFQFARELYFDGLTKTSLMQSLIQLHKCRLFIIWKMQQLFGESPQKDEPMFR
jgi:hypothetical protein